MSLKHGPEDPKSESGRPWSLAARLTAWYAGSAFLLIAAVSGFSYALLVDNLEREDHQLLADEFQSVRSWLLEKPGETAALQEHLQWNASKREHFRFLVRVLDARGRRLVESPELESWLPLDMVRARVPNEQSAELETPAGKSIHVYVGTVTSSEPAAEWTVHVAMDRTLEEDLLRRYRRGLAVVLACALVGCAIIGYQIARRGMRPVRNMAETARKIRSTTLHQRIETPGLPSELSVLAGTFNEMLDRLEESFERLSRFSADIAHELRTPVNNIRGETEVALSKPRTPEEYREVLGSSLEECGRLSRMIDSLLFLARAEGSEIPITTERVDVARELETVREFYDAPVTDSGLALRVRVDAPTVAYVDRTLFQRAVGNLISNAIAHTPAGGEIVVSATIDNGRVRVEVRDTGRGIPEEHLPHVFDRFYRVDFARSSESGGVGLGLAIAKSIAALHGGSAKIQSEVGKGTCVSLEFPGAEPTPVDRRPSYNRT